MKVFIFGNPIVADDNSAFKVAEYLKNKIPEVDFAIINPNEDIPFADLRHPVLIDAIENIKKVTILNEEDIDKISPMKSVSVHDWDLGFQLKYLKKLGKLNKITIIGLPMGKKINYLRIQSILRKLVEQEMQGS
jgi:Ni,Fe-hydrogenase maturation factor